MLIMVVVDKWKVDCLILCVENGMVFGVKGKKVIYGLFVVVVLKLLVFEMVVLKDLKDFIIVGKCIKWLDIFVKVNGMVEFGIDVKLFGMVYVLIEMCLVIGGMVKSFDVVKVKVMFGVIDVV